MINGDALKQARSAAGMSQAALAEAVGTSRETIRDIELGVNSGAGLIEAIASVLGVDPTDLDPEYTPGGQQKFNLDPRMPQAKGYL